MAKLQRDHRPSSRNAPDRAQTEGMDQASRALSYLISGVLLWGGLGWLGDRFLHTKFLIPIGIVIGAALGCYLIIKRFGQEARTPPPDVPGASRSETAPSGPAPSEITSSEIDK